LRTRGQSLILTDQDAHTATYSGPPFVYGFERVGTSCGLIAANAAASIDEGVVWMGQRSFFIYAGGSVRDLPCEVADYVFSDMNNDQRSKVHAVVNCRFNEIWWFYPSALSTEVDRYVIYNYLDNTWSIGNLDRTAWHDSGIFTFPIASNSAGNAFNQENGVNDESSALASSLETGYFSGDANGDNIIFIRRIIPDTSFSSGTTLNFEIKSKKYPNDTETTKGPFAVTSSTNKLNLRSRGRSFQCKWSSSAVDTSWRLGTWRAEGQADGTR